MSTSVIVRSIRTFSSASYERLWYNSKIKTDILFVAIFLSSYVYHITDVFIILFPLHSSFLFVSLSLFFFMSTIYIYIMRLSKKQETKLFVF